MSIIYDNKISMILTDSGLGFRFFSAVGMNRSSGVVKSSKKKAEQKV